MSMSKLERQAEEQFQNNETKEIWQLNKMCDPILDPILEGK